MKRCAVINVSVLAVHLDAKLAARSNGELLVRGVFGDNVCTLDKDAGRELVGITGIDERRLANDDVSVLVQRVEVSSRIKEGRLWYLLM